MTSRPCPSFMPRKAEISNHPPKLAENILAILQQVLAGHKGVISLHEPYFHGNEWDYVKECLDSGWISSIGGYVDKFEARLAEFTGVRRVVAVVNGTAGLHICLKLAGVQAGDEVLVPALTFVATANAVAYCGALPHFVDSEDKTLGLNPRELEDYLNEIAEPGRDGCLNRKTGRIIRAAVPMHTSGHPVDMDPLVEVCRRFGLELVEDAAESLGSYYKGRHTGNWGRLAVLSFNGNKTITTGGGGAIMTNDEELGKLAKHLCTTAKVPHKWNFYHDHVGYNYRLPNINAALGCAQMEQLPSFLRKKRALAERYARAFQGLRGVQFFTEPEFAQSNYWMNALLLDPLNSETADPAEGFAPSLPSPPPPGSMKVQSLLDVILELTNRHGLATRPVWTLMHKLPMYQECPRMPLSAAESIAQRLINIPSSAFLEDLYV
jgi:perosamine synthetase